MMRDTIGAARMRTRRLQPMEKWKCGLGKIAAVFASTATALRGCDNSARGWQLFQAGFVF